MIFLNWDIFSKCLNTLYFFKNNDTFGNTDIETNLVFYSCISGNIEQI